MSESIERSTQAAYEQVYEYIKAETVAHPEQKAIREATLKGTLCANGSVTPEQVDTALEALGDNEKIQYGSGWITPVVDRQWHRDAIGYVVEHGDEPQEFVSVANRAMQNHEWEDV